MNRNSDAEAVMRKLLLLFLISMLAVPAHGAQRLSVAQLRQAIAGVHRESDKKLARLIGEMELTERLSRADLDTMNKALPGKRSRIALLRVADEAAFLDPPAAEMLPDAAPSAQEQREMLARAAEFASQQGDALVAFEAVRRTQHFQDVRVYPYSNKIEYYTPGSFHWLEAQVDDVRCAAGGDVMQDEIDRDLDRRMARRRQPLIGFDPRFGYHVVWEYYTWNVPNVTQDGMKPTGAFGPWLQAITADTSDARTEWGYWERGDSAKLAVMRFRIPSRDSHYTIEYTFKPASAIASASDHGREYVGDPGYHGEIAFDPATGRIARILVMCDFAKGEPMQRANMRIDYGPVQIGDASYDLPVRGVAETGFQMATHEYLFDNGISIGDRSDHFPVTSLDDITFSDYRAVRPAERILPLKSLDRPRK